MIFYGYQLLEIDAFAFVSMCNIAMLKQDDEYWDRPRLDFALAFGDIEWTGLVVYSEHKFDINSVVHFI